MNSEKQYQVSSIEYRVKKRKRKKRKEKKYEKKREQATLKYKLQVTRCEM
ncbi:MAG: hypothetical protein ABIK21_02185 [bacterium]